MARPRKNPLPVNVAAQNDTAAQAKAAVQETAAETPAEETKPVKKVGRPVGSTKAKAEAKKASAAKTVKKVAEKAEKKVAEVKKATRTAKAKNTDAAVIIQYNGKNIETKNIVETAKKKWLESGKRESSIKSLEVYVNVTEGMAYPVINGDAQNGFSC